MYTVALSYREIIKNFLIISSLKIQVENCTWKAGFLDKTQEVLKRAHKNICIWSNTDSNSMSRQETNGVILLMTCLWAIFLRNAIF